MSNTTSSSSQPFNPFACTGIAVSSRDGRSMMSSLRGSGLMPTSSELSCLALSATLRRYNTRRLLKQLLHCRPLRSARTLAQACDHGCTTSWPGRLVSSPTMTQLLIIRQAALPASVLVGSLLVPRNTLHAEEPSDVSLPPSVRSRVTRDSNKPQSQNVRRKPIYDDAVPVRNTAPLPDRPEESHLIADKERTYTNQLVSYIRTARMFTHAHVALVENKFNDGAKRFFDFENNVTTTIANLAPDARTGEKVMPGVLYVVVAGMAGSIMTRNRNILLRATVPVALAVGASNYLLPHTTRNVEDLVWTWEKRYPVIADNHLRAKHTVQRSIEDAKRATFGVRERIDEGVRKSRESLEGWVSQGR